jgi:hypothetical protein
MACLAAVATARRRRYIAAVELDLSDQGGSETKESPAPLFRAVAV